MRKVNGLILRGQAIGLPPSMTLFAFVGVVVTSASAIIYGSPEWDPVRLAGKFESKIMVSFAMIGIIISTLATNIAANIVSPANDFSNLSPAKIDFKIGGYITGIIGSHYFSMEINGGSQRLYFHLVNRIFKPVRPYWRNIDS